MVNNERNANCELGYDRTLSIATMTFNGGNGAADDSLSNYKVIRVGDIAFEGHTNKVHAYGRFVLNDAGDGLMSPRFSCLRPIVEQRYSFWKYYIPREESMRPILVNATKSGTMMNELVPDDLMRESILVPCLAEQEVIGNSLSQLDHLITLHQRMCSIFCFCAFGSRTNFNQSSKDSFGYYATCVPCRRCARCHRRWLQAPLTSPRRLRFRFFLRWRFDRLASARKSSIISLMRCRSGSLSPPLRGSVACVSRIFDSEGKQVYVPCRISGAAGSRANHGKRPFARKSHSWTLAIGFYRTSWVDIAPAMKTSVTTYPCAHVQVDEEAGNISGCIAESACCCQSSA